MSDPSVCEWRRPDGTVLARWLSPATWMPGVERVIGPVELWYDGERVATFDGIPGKPILSE